MPCESPIRAYQKGGAGPLSFNPPNTVKQAASWRALDIPCGICLMCRQETARQWAVRIGHEAQMHEESCFVTLTYAEKYLPEWGSLKYEHLRNFWKKLRNHLDKKVRYYAVGEYGDESFRPHYHACLFGHAFTEEMYIVQDQPRFWTSPELAALWPYGSHRIGMITHETAQYTASYVIKKLRSKQQYVRVEEETGELIPLEQPRSFMSKNLGKEWWRLYGRHVTAHDLVVINGRVQKPPKQYDRWLGAEDEKKLEEIKKKRKELSSTYSPQELHARAQNAHARAKRKSKKV